MVITKTKPSQQLGAVPPYPHIWDLLLDIGIPPEKFPLMTLLPVHLRNLKTFPSTKMC